MRRWWTDERVALLVAEAESWRGTPFAANSASKGRGVSCHKLCEAIFDACGYPVALDVPDVPIAHARFSTVSFVTQWFSGRVDFEAIQPTGALFPGDVLGFRIGRIVHHLGILLPDNQFAHAMDGIGTTVNALADATWYSRLENVWRARA